MAGDFCGFDCGGAERVRIIENGNVSFGVGSSPTYKIEAAATSGGNGIKVTRGTNSFFEQYQSTTGGVYLAASGSGAFLGFRTGTTAGTTAERVRITEGASADSVVIWNNASNSSAGRNFRVMAYDSDSYFALGNDGNNCSKCPARVKFISDNGKIANCCAVA